MTLTGTYSRALDEKQRLAVPKRLREQFGGEQADSLYIAPGTDKSLALYSPAAFEELARKLAQQSPNRVEVRNYLRLFYSQAENVPLDRQGRIRVPDRLIAFAGLRKEIMLLGVQDHAEIWDRENWEQFVSTHESGFDEMAAKAFE